MAANARTPLATVHVEPRSEERLAARGGYEFAHPSPGLEIGFSVLVAREPRLP